MQNRPHPCDAVPTIKLPDIYYGKEKSVYTTEDVYQIPFTLSIPIFLYQNALRNGPDKNDSNNGNEHVGIQLVCKKVITFLLSVLTSDWLKQQTVNKTS